MDRYTRPHFIAASITIFSAAATSQPNLYFSSRRLGILDRVVIAAFRMFVYVQLVLVCRALHLPSLYDILDQDFANSFCVLYGRRCFLRVCLQGAALLES